MNRFATSVLGVGATLALSVGGLSAAAATEKADPTGGDDYPKTEVVKIDEKFVLPAGSACKDEIKVHEKAAFKLTELSEKKAVLRYKDGSRVSFYNPKTRKKITVGESGVAHLKYLEEDTEVRASGENVFIGSGIKGIAYVRGHVKFTVHDDGQEDQKIVIHKVKGKYVEICQRLGTSPAHHDQGGRGV